MADLMLRSAIARLEYWQTALKAATENGDAQQIKECARFVEEYGKLIADMAATKLPN